MMANKRAITGRSEKEINDGLERVIAAMQRGLSTEGYLPGPIRLHRKAPLFYQRARGMSRNAELLLVYLCAYAFATAEENAAGHRVVTTPTCGTAGVIPALIVLLRRHGRIPCDPVLGYVQIHCIERNAMGAIKAYTSYLIARECVPEWHLVSLDKAIAATNLRGRDMPFQCQETSQLVYWPEGAERNSNGKPPPCPRD